MRETYHWRKRVITYTRDIRWIVARIGVLGGLCLLVLGVAACGAPRPASSSSPAAPPSGEALFKQLDCVHCHSMQGKGPGPSLAGLYGTTILLESGEEVTMDDAYIRRSILEPHAETHAGYPPIMPAYAGRVDDEELAALIEYIRTLQP